MRATIVLAPAAGGKTAHCVDAVQAKARARPLAPIWVLLPDRTQARYFNRRLAEAGGALGVHVGTFDAFYRAILDAAGTPVAEARSPLVYRLVRAAIRDVAAAGGLAHYAPIAALPGFAEAAAKAIGELKNARVTPQRFLDEGGEDARLVELSRIYAAYQVRLTGLGWVDPEGLNWLAVAALETNPELVADWALVVVDGFDDFEPARRDALVALARAKPGLIVTLPGERGFARPAFRRFQRAFDTLAACLSGDDVTFANVVDLVELRQPPRLAGRLAEIERALFEPAQGAAEPASTAVDRGAISIRPLPVPAPIAFVELASPAEEAREALRWVKARRLRDGVTLRDCLIVTPAPERYRPLLREAAAEFDLPIEFTEGEPLITTPGATALADLLDLPRQDYPHRLLADTLRSPYFRLPAFRPGDADLLEAVSRAHGIAQGLDRWRAALDRLARARAASDEAEGGETDDADAASGADLPRGAAAARLRAALDGLAAHLAPPAPRSSRDWVVWLEDLIAELRFAPAEHAARPAAAGPTSDPREPAGNGPGGDDPAARRDRAVAEALDEVLRALVLGETFVDAQGGAGARAAGWDYETFAGELRGLLETELIRERVDARQDAVLVTKVLESRGPRFAAVTMLGLSEGLFPQVETEDVLLDEDLRERLGLEPRLGREQRALFYLVATRANRWLRFSRPYMSESGEEWTASPYWNAALAALGQGPGAVQHIRPDDPRPLPDAASIAELLFWLVRRKEIPGRLHANFQIRDRLDNLRAAREVIRARLAPRAAGPHEGDAAGLADRLAAWYGPDHAWSPSRLEAYRSCGLRFLVESLLGLEEPAPPEPGPDARQLGTLLHAILDAAYRAADDPSDPEAVIAALGPIAAERFAAAPASYGFEPTAYWQVERTHWIAQLEVAVRALAEPAGQWRPVAFELPFGLQDMPPLVLETGDPAIGAVRVRGVIDRVDRDGAGGLRVVDYKTGTSHLSAPDLIAGRRLQLPLYALAAEHSPLLEADGEPAGQAVEGLYWSIRAGKAGSLRLSRFDGEQAGIANAGPEGAIDLVRRHIAEVVAGVRGGAFAPEPPAGGCPAYCAAKGWCWRHT